jgi:AcrR family transcriptional regulator
MRVKTTAKRQAILNAASEVFRTRGFAGGTMTDVAEHLGASKATLYRYFRTKDDLFVALMLDAVFDEAEAIFATLRPTGDLRGTLEAFGVSFLTLSLTETALAVRRNSIAEGGRSGLGEKLYDRGARVLWSKMADFLQGEMAAGRLRSDEPWRVAMHLRGMLEADVINRALLGAPVDARPAHLRAHAAAAVDVLLRAYDPLDQRPLSEANATPPSTGKVAPTT